MDGMDGRQVKCGFHSIVGTLHRQDMALSEQASRDTPWRVLTLIVAIDNIYFISLYPVLDDFLIT